MVMRTRVTCPVEGCTEPVSGKVMCLPHWKMVPFTAQFDVYREWANARATHNNLARIAAARKYLEARKRSIEIATNASRRAGNTTKNSPKEAN